MSRLEALRLRAERMGLWARWTPLVTPEADKRRFLAWLDAGAHAGMDWLVRTADTRVAPRTRFGWAKSALVLAAPYAYPELERPRGGVRLGRVARYAWSPDYHRALAAALDELAAFARGLGVEAKGYVDFGPLLEWSLARQAGIGWQGKNTLILVEGFGSYLHLAVLLTSLEAPEPAPAPARCGRCTACVRACPTAAIGALGVDARRCISYWTIEHRGDWPAWVYDLTGDWLFGCDDCQTSCPWNRFAKGYWNRFAPDPELAYPDLTLFFTLSGRAFARRFAHTAFARPGRAAMARNALAVIANLQAVEGIPLVKKAVHDQSSRVRKAAAEAAFRLGLRGVLDALTKDLDPGVAAWARARLEGAPLDDLGDALG